MNHFNRLPEEILTLIFSEIDNKQLLELESVCKHWKNVLRSRAQYWNTEIKLNCKSTDDFKSLERFARKILLRSRGEMQKWQIKIATSVLDHYHELFKHIPTSNAQTLDIEISDRECYRNDIVRHIIFEEECSILMKSIKNCSNLKSLNITADSNLTVSFGSDIKDFPIANCKLETLKLENVSLASLSIDGSIFQMVSQAKHIDLSGHGIGTDTHINRLIDSAQHTLEFCSIRLSGIRSSDDAMGFINLPRLKKLKIFTYHGLSLFSDPIQCSLICPNLRQLTLSGNITSSLCANLLTDSIETLYLELNEYFCKSLQNNLRKCSNLSILRITFDYPYQDKFPSQLLEEVLDELVSLPIKEFILSFMVLSNQEDEQIILSFFRKWSNNSRKMKLFLLYQDVQLPKEILEELSQYCEVFKTFARDQEDSIYSEEELQLRSYGYYVGR